jgi:hypothetical protein
MKMQMRRILMALVVLMASVGAASADTQWAEVSWFTAQSVAHSIHYAIYNATIACSQTALYYVEPPPINGIAKKLNASTDQTGQYKCQNVTQGAIKIYNDGSVGINVTAKFNQITTGVRPKLGGSDAAWQQVCSGTCTTGDCTLSNTCLLLSTVGDTQIAYNIPQNSSQEYWLWADFVGVAGTTAPTKGNMTTNATMSAN